jgi:hypothetical protein
VSLAELELGDSYDFGRVSGDLRAAHENVERSLGCRATLFSICAPFEALAVGAALLEALAARPRRAIPGVPVLGRIGEALTSRVGREQANIVGNARSLHDAFTRSDVLLPDGAKPRLASLSTRCWWGGPR